MKQRTVKTYIKQLIKRYGGRKELANELGVTERYIYMLESGKKTPSATFGKLIKVVMGESHAVITCEDCGEININYFDCPYCRGSVTIEEA